MRLPLQRLLQGHVPTISHFFPPGLYDAPFEGVNRNFTHADGCPRDTRGRYHPDVARFAVLTLSDRAAEGTREDLSGDRLVERITADGHELTARALLPDDRARIAAQLRDWCDGSVADIVVTTGGTGLTPRDVTPEATSDIAEREVPGIQMAIYLEGLKKTPLAVLSRGMVITRGSTMVVNLPGSPRAMDDGMDVLLPLVSHIVQLLAGPVEHTP